MLPHCTVNGDDDLPPASALDGGTQAEAQAYADILVGQKQGGRQAGMQAAFRCDHRGHHHQPQHHQPQPHQHHLPSTYPTPALVVVVVWAPTGTKIQTAVVSFHLQTWSMTFTECLRLGMTNLRTKTKEGPLAAGRSAATHPTPPSHH